MDPERGAGAPAYIPDLPFWFTGEGTKSPALLGRRFPVHDRCREPYCWDLYFRQRRPEKVGVSIRRQLDRMTALLGDRPRAILDHAELPFRGLRRNAWGLDASGKRVIDRRWITTPQEAACAFLWLQGRYVDGEWLADDPKGMKLGRLLRIVQTGLRKRLREGEIDPIVAGWRASKAAPKESRFETPRDAEPFDVRWFVGRGEGGFM